LVFRDTIAEGKQRRYGLCAKLGYVYLGTNGENLILTGMTNINGTGNTSDKRTDRQRGSQHLKGARQRFAE